MLTDSQRKALGVLRDHGPIRPREFAKKMWPDSPGWDRMARSGPSGAHKGGGMYLAGGGYLGRLRKAGLAHHRGWKVGYAISPKGRKALNEESRGREGQDG